MLDHEPVEPAGPGAQFLPGELVGAGGGARADVGDPDPPPGELRPVGLRVPVRGVDEGVGDAGAVQRRMEPVAGPGEVGAGRRRPEARVDPDEQQPQRLRQEVGDGGIAEALELGTAETHASRLRVALRAPRRPVGIARAGNRDYRRIRRVRSVRSVPRRRRPS